MTRTDRFVVGATIAAMLCLVALALAQDPVVDPVADPGVIVPKVTPTPEGWVKVPPNYMRAKDDPAYVAPEKMAPVTFVTVAADGTPHGETTCAADLESRVRYMDECIARLEAERAGYQAMLDKLNEAAGKGEKLVETTGK